MPRRPKLRVSYYDDAQFLLRLGKAILDDKSRPEDWRRAMDERIRALAAELMTAPPRKAEESKPVPTNGGSKKARKAS
jgi:hypothetical protein